MPGGLAPTERLYSFSVGELARRVLEYAEKIGSNNTACRRFENRVEVIVYLDRNRFPRPPE